MHAIDIPDTPEVRSKFAEAQSFALERFGLSEGSVAVWEDGSRASHDPDHTFEWWYFDMHFDDGSTLVTTFSNKPHTSPDGPLQPSVLLIQRDAAGKSVRTSLTCAAEEFTAATDACDVHVGANWVRGDLDTYTLHIENGDETVDLTMVRGAPSWRPGAGVSFFDAAKKDYLAWVVPVPYGTVTGTISGPAGARQVTGTGYHDHNWGNKLMGSMLDHWFWGRAHVEDFTLVYVMLTTNGFFGLGALNIATLYLAKGETILTDDSIPLRLSTSDDVPGPGDQSYPRDLLWTWEKDGQSLRFHITDPQMIEALDMSEDEPPWKRTLTHVFAHPMYYDFNADIELDVDVAGVRETVTGRTLYEKMMFR